MSPGKSSLGFPSSEAKQGPQKRGSQFQDSDMEACPAPGSERSRDLVSLLWSRTPTWMEVSLGPPIFPTVSGSLSSPHALRCFIGREPQLVQTSSFPESGKLCWVFA